MKAWKHYAMQTSHKSNPWWASTRYCSSYKRCSMFPPANTHTHTYIHTYTWHTSQGSNKLSSHATLNVIRVHHSSCATRNPKRRRRRRDSPVDFSTLHHSQTYKWRIYTNKMPRAFLIKKKQSSMANGWPISPKLYSPSSSGIASPTSSSTSSSSSLSPRNDENENVPYRSSSPKYTFDSQCKFFDFLQSLDPQFERISLIK